MSDTQTKKVRQIAGLLKYQEEITKKIVDNLKYELHEEIINAPTRNTVYIQNIGSFTVEYLLQDLYQRVNFLSSQNSDTRIAELENQITDLQNQITELKNKT